MTPRNERPTPLTDAVTFNHQYHNGIAVGIEVVASDFARTLERSLAERTEERDGAKAGYAAINTRIYGKGGECFELDKARDERDTALAKLDTLDKDTLSLSVLLQDCLALFNLIATDDDDNGDFQIDHNYRKQLDALSLRIKTTI